MSKSCTITPTTHSTKTGQEVSSQLFTDASNAIGRKNAKLIYGMSETGIFDGIEGLERNADGEVLFESLDAVLRVRERFNEKFNKNGVNEDAIKLHLLSSSGEPIAREDLRRLYEDARAFNDKNNGYVASVIDSEIPGVYHVSIERESPQSIQTKRKMRFNSTLNNELLALINRLGFDIQFLDDPKFSGKFDPRMAVENANGLKTVIAVAHGERGEDAVPEEVSHLLLIGMDHTSIMKEIHELFTDDVVREVLGDMYDEYVRRYSGGAFHVSRYLREEAEAKILAMLLKEHAIHEGEFDSFDELWKGIVERLSKATGADIDAAIEKATMAMNRIASIINKDIARHREYQAEIDAIKSQAIANDTFMKAPNGKKSNLNEQQWLQVRTKEFKKWFGDWESVSRFNVTQALKELEKYANEDDKIHSRLIKFFINTFKNNITEYEPSFGGGRFNIRFGTIEFAPFDKSKNDFDAHEHQHNKKVALHELIHSVTSSILISYYVQKDSSYSKYLKDVGYTGELLKLSKEQVAALDKLSDIRKTVVDYIEKHSSKVAEINKKYNGVFGSATYFTIFDSNELDEFISEAISNPALQEIMSIIPSEGIATSKKSIFEYVLELLGKVFNLNDTILNDFFIYAGDAFNSATKNNISKVVDENGEPLVVYHHTRKGVGFIGSYHDGIYEETITKKDRPIPVFNLDVTGAGAVFFTISPSAKNIYYPSTQEDKFFTAIPAFLNIRRITEADGIGNGNIVTRGEVTSIREDGFDGFYQNFKTGDIFYGVFNSNQIKSAETNTGEFSVEDDNIYDMAGLDSVEPLIDKETIMAHREMFDAAQDAANVFKEQAHKGLELLSKRYSMMRAQSRGKNEELSEQRKSIEAIKDEVDSAYFVSACADIIAEMARQIGMLGLTISHLGAQRGAFYKDVSIISSFGEQIDLVHTLNDAYGTYLDMFAGIDNLIAGIDITVNAQDKERISALAHSTISASRSLSQDARTLQAELTKNLIILQMGNTELTNPAVDDANKRKGVAAEMLMTTAWRDMGYINRDILSLGDATNPLVAMVHEMVVRRQASRDSRINDIVNQIEEFHSLIKKESIANDYIYERDENGVPTGRFKSQYNFKLFNEDRKAFIAEQKELAKQSGAPYRILRRNLANWERARLAEVVVDPITARTEMVPNPNFDNGRYHIDFQQGWSDAQKQYYNAMIQLKGALDSYIMSPSVSLYKAPQARKDIADMFDIHNPKAAFSQMWQKIKDDIVITEYDTEFGELEFEETEETKDGKVRKKKTIIHPKGFDGRPLRRVPVFLTNTLSDMSLLETDATQAMISYACMAINYDEMTQIAGALKMLNNWVKEDMRIQHTRGGKNLYDKFTAAGTTFMPAYTTSARGSNIDKAIEDYRDRLIYGMKVNELPEIPISENFSLNTTKALKQLKNLSSNINLGLNIFSASANKGMGDAQMILEAASGRFFNYKELALATKEYDTEIFPYLAELNSTQRKSKLYHLINLFNMTENFDQDVKDATYQKNPVRRVLGKGSLLFMQTAGEHVLHAKGGIAMLYHIKLQVPGRTNPVSLYDIFEVQHDERGYHIGFKSKYNLDDKPLVVYLKKDGKAVAHKMIAKGFDIVNVDEKTSIITVMPNDLKKFYQNVNVMINNVNASMHGGYSDAEKGNGNKSMWFQLLMQFRQWMPATYNKRFAKRHYDPMRDEDVEGIYNTAWKFFSNLISEMIKGQLRFSLLYNQMTEAEQANMRMFFTELTEFATLAVLCHFAKPFEQKDSAWYKKLLAYTLERVRLDIGALIPNPAMLSNAWTILKSPMAGVESMSKLFKLFEIWNIFDTVETGPYEGWSVYLRNLIKATPAQNVFKAVDLPTENYMFTIFTRDFGLAM